MYTLFRLLLKVVFRPWEDVYHAEYFPIMFLMTLSLDLRSRQTDGWMGAERGRQTGHVSGGESGILWGLIDSILWANDLPRALGRNDETSLHDTVTLPMSRCHLHLSVFSYSLFAFLSTWLFSPSSGKCIDSPLFVLSPTHIQLSQRRTEFTELMGLI